MKIKAKIFEFTSYQFYQAEKRLVFNYQIELVDGRKIQFTETVVLPNIPKTSRLPEGLIDRLLFNLHLILGISYFKLFLPETIKLYKPLVYDQAIFWNTVYRKGLGEFFYRNNINPKTIPQFPFDRKLKPPLAFELPTKKRSLIGIGGGKDSIVVAELLKQKGEELTAFIVETQKKSKIQDRIVKEIGTSKIVIKRLLDPKMLNPLPGSLTGHIPISAIYAFLGLISAIFYDYKYIVVGNEKSSDFGNTTYLGEDINHQWSKSSEFERRFGEYVNNYITNGVTYFSLLRPFYDIRVAEMFTRYKKYFPIFSSCNRNFSITKRSTPTLWCNKCPKCLSTFALLSPFVNKEDLIKIFGKNLYQDKSNISVFKDLLGYGHEKPFECVGTSEEIKTAFYLARKMYKNDLAIKTNLTKIKNPKELIKKVFAAYPAQTIPTRFRFLGMKSALILGFGKEGKKTKEYLNKKFPHLKIGIADQKTDPNYLEKQENFDIAIKTPGIPKHKVKIQYTTATNLFFSQIKNITIGVTGSKGKSTTSSLIYSILKEAGFKVQLLGNIGQPMLEALIKTQMKDEIFVLELSSFQLDDIMYSPNIAVVLNLFPEHMDYHANIRNYYQAKKNIINFQKANGLYIYNPNYKILKNWAKKAKAQSIPFVGEIPIKDTEIPLIGNHNRDNIRGATTVARLFNVPGAIISRAIKKFKPLPHRLEFVGTLRGINFYDDAISTTPQSTIAAIKSLPNIGTIFLGGTDRGYDFAELEKIIRQFNIKNVALFPPSGDRIFRDTKWFNILKTKSMREAVEFAYQSTKKGDICLLSTASPSFSLWKNFEEKGDQFQYFVRNFS